MEHALNSGRNQDSPSISPTFCVYPWMEFILGPTADVKLCCIADDSLRTESGESYRMDTSSIGNIWNSRSMKEVRKRMLSGEKVKACEHCYYQESLGQVSYREANNWEWLNGSSGKEIMRRVEYSRKNDGEVSSPPFYLDIRLGNICNLKCRMCNSENSSKIWQEREELLKEKTAIASLVDTSCYSEEIKSFHDWYDNLQLWEEIHSWIPQMKKLYFTGGEPTLIQHNWELLDYVIEKGWSENICLEFNLNCTYVPDKLLKTFNKFKKVRLRLSVDGYGTVQEYIRSPSKWIIIEKNVRRILKNKNNEVDITFTPVVQVYNVLGLTELLQWINNLQKEFGSLSCHFILCTGPDFLDIAILPQNVRKIALKRIQTYQDTCSDANIHLAEQLESVKTILKTEFKKRPTRRHLGQFFQYTRILDKKREESFKEALPELHELLISGNRWIFIADLEIRMLEMLKKHMYRYSPFRIRFFHINGSLVRFFYRTPIAKAWYFSKYQFHKRFMPAYTALLSRTGK